MKRRLAAHLIGGLLILLGAFLVLAGYDVVAGFASIRNHKSWAAGGAGLVIIGILVEILGFRLRKRKFPPPRRGGC